MTIPTQRVLEALLAEPMQELYGLEIGEAAGLQRHRASDPRPAGGVRTPGAPVLQAHRGRRAGGAGGAGPCLPTVAFDAAAPAAGAGMTPPRAPLILPRAGCELAVRRLPDLNDRLRYRAEFLADLHALTPAAQMRYAAGVLSQAVALRAALDASPTRSEEDAMSLTTAERSFNWRCRLFRKHRYVRAALRTAVATGPANVVATTGSATRPSTRAGSPQGAACDRSGSLDGSMGP